MTSATKNSHLKTPSSQPQQPKGLWSPTLPHHLLLLDSRDANSKRRPKTSKTTKQLNRRI